MAGGTRVDTPPAALKIAVANSGGYFILRMAGIATDPIAAVLALGDPEIPDINIVEEITTKPNPPYILPTKTIARSTIRLANPPCDINCPASTNKGIAISGNESSPDKNF